MISVAAPDGLMLGIGLEMIDEFGGKPDKENQSQLECNKHNLNISKPLVKKNKSITT